VSLTVPPEDGSIQTGIPGKDIDDLNPRAQASLRFTEQGRTLLQSGRPDDAISLFERGINLNPANGLNYYYLSEALIIKGQLEQAVEFNELAALYLEQSPQWQLRVQKQKARIAKIIGSLPSER